MDKGALLKVRNEMKKKKPDFFKHDSHKRKELPKKWRRPKGLHAKMRLGKKGHPRCVAVGFGSPNAVKGLNKNGLKNVRVCSAAELQKIDPKTECAVIAKGVGARKKMDIAGKAMELKIKICNLEKPEEFLKKTKEAIEKKKAQKKAKVTKEKTKKKATASKKEEPKKLTEEEQKDAEKKEKDKLLTKKDIKT